MNDNSEYWSISLQEDIIWSMRTSHKEIPARKQSSIVEALTLVMPDKSETFMMRLDPELAAREIMASFVSDEQIKSNCIYKDCKKINCCLLFARISGFLKPICRLIKDAHESVSKNLTTLHAKMAQEIMTNGGDVIKFSENCIISIWKANNAAAMSQNVHQAIDCAIVLHKICQEYTSNHARDLSVQLTIDAGPIYLTFLGNEMFAAMVLFGKLIEETIDVRKRYSSENIICSEVSLKYINANEYIHERIPNEPYFTIRGLAVYWRQCNEVIGESDLGSRNVDPELESVASVIYLDSGELRSSAMKIAIENLESDYFRKFLVESLRRSIEYEEPLSNLNEIRYLTIAVARIAVENTDIENILEVANEALVIFQSHAVQHNGTVYDILISKKYIHIYLAFGMRGFKHSLECKKCLIAVLSSKTTIEKQCPNIATFSIAACRGKCVCSIVGHSLRRSYSIWGLVSGKAKKLATNYPNMVICDQGVYLHSKLKYNCFKLHPRTDMYTKDYPGLIYEVLMTETHPKFVDKPTLGNINEIALFRECLTNWRKGADDNFANILIIEGHSGEGKSRLLHDMIKECEPGIPTHLIRLCANDKKMPFTMIRHIFGEPLGWTEVMNNATKIIMLNKLLENFENEIVRNTLYKLFELTTEQSLDMRDAESIRNDKDLNEGLLTLTQKCFKMPCLIAIDDLDNMDTESWVLLEPLLETKLFFLLAACKKSYELPDSEIFKKHLGEIIQMNGLEKKFISSFACQFLNVYALPPELEFALIETSYGNPVWIENLLMLLLQSGSIYIEKVPYITLQTYGLISPLIFRLQKMSSGDIQFIMKLIEFHSHSKGSKGSKDFDDFWNSLADICLDVDQLYNIRRRIVGLGLSAEECEACFLNKNFDIKKIDTENADEIYYSQLFDYLNYDEQTFLKCCSVLGFTFKRCFVLQLLPGNIRENLENIVQRMFEMQILICAAGDFTDRPKLMRDEMKDFAKSLADPFCQCRNLPEQGEQETELPKYAFCGYLRFKESSLRDIVYKSLNFEQRKEIHKKAITYLVETTRKCKSCGGDEFQLLQNPKEEELKRHRKKQETKQFSLTEGYDSRFYSTLFQHVDTISSLSVVQAEHRSSLFLMHPHSSVGTNNSYYSRNTAPNQSAMLKRLLFLFDSTQAHAVNVDNIFSDLDFTYCECRDILINYFYEMIIHHRGSGEVEQMIGYMIQYADACIKEENISEAIRILEVAYSNVENELVVGVDIPLWKQSLIKSKLRTIYASVLIKNEKYDQAMKLLHTVMIAYNKPVPRNSFCALAKLKKLELRVLYAAITHSYKMNKKDLDLSQYHYYCDVSVALGLLCDIYTEKKNTRFAQLTAVWSLVVSWRAHANFTRTAEAYVRMMRTYQCVKSRRFVFMIQKMALIHCNDLVKGCEFEEFRVLTDVYYNVMQLRFQYCEGKNAIALSHIVVGMMYRQQFERPFLQALIHLSSNLLVSKYYEECSTILVELDFYATFTEDVESKAWYYGQSMLFNIILGYTIVSYKDCRNFYLKECQNSVMVSEPMAQNRLVVYMWLWCLRNERWEEAITYFPIVKKVVANLSQISVATMRMSLFIAEGYLLFLVYKLNKLSLQEIPTLCDTIDKLLVFMKKSSSIQPVLFRSYMLRKAYYLYIQNEEETSFEILENTLKLSNNNSINLDVDIITHMIKAWHNQLPESALNFWKDHSKEDNLLSHQELNNQVEIRGFFTYPRPIYVTDKIFANVRKGAWRKKKYSIELKIHLL